ncbi:hypothetical protein BX600DRAFT_506700 [Xylariales sp. PMI_506]|nr:hypothetical protein BX600DRAFT_506700 [Xylariales sp. PMI_506]
MGAAHYYEVAQDDDNRNENGGSSSPASVSPTFSSSPMPLLPSIESRFTPLSMESDHHGLEEINGGSIHDGQDLAKLGLGAATDNTGPMGLAQLVTAPARATAALSQKRDEYELVSSGEIGSRSSPSLRSASADSPIQINTSPGIEISPNRSSDTASGSTNSSNQQHPSSGLTAQDSTSTNPRSGSPSSSILQRQQHYQSQIQDSSAPAPAPRQNSVTTPIVIPKPILRTASTRSVTLVHPSPSPANRSRSSSRASNIAQLEATAERLSMTSSIEDAIRDLHEEQKRSDSRRSSILAASVGTTFDHNAKESFPFITRQLSGASSILETNTAARHGGYSPAGYVMSPSHSLRSNPSRLRSGSYNRPDIDITDFVVLSRHGPGKSSVRSTKSVTKPSLTDIVEMEPTGLTLAAMDEADRLDEHPEEEALQLPPLEDIDLTPNADDYLTSAENGYLDHHTTEEKKELRIHEGDEDRRSSNGSTGTYEQAQAAFADFDGAHCSPEVDEQPEFFGPSMAQDLSLQMPQSLVPPAETMVSRRPQPRIRPQSYLDPATGQQMLYYPARVPMMLNLPQKLSKKPKAAERNLRRSQVLSAMLPPTQEPSWLPEVLPEPLFDPLRSGSESNLATPVAPPSHDPEYPQEHVESESLPGSPSHQDTEPYSQARLNPPAFNEEARKSRMSVGLSVMDPADKRKSRMSYKLDNLPPQLRASAFFDMPSETPAIQLKDGSAMATLDSILDASASAPVSAFTDHAFAGKLGDEVYGTEKKRKSHMPRANTAGNLEVKKRSSIFHLRTPSRLSGIEGSNEDRRQPTSAGISGHHDEHSDDEHAKLADSIDGEHVHEDGNLEVDEEDEEESDLDNLAINGPPTTLLAELHMRKQQNKLRTRPIARAYPNGMHSTLLEIDAVAELEKKNRRGKRVNLAWEEPHDDAAESEDEDVPLGLLNIAKSGANRETLIEELNRPLGLMEQRKLEDNEPLSRRRDRLQGIDSNIAKRQSMLSLGVGATTRTNGGLGPPSPGMHAPTPEAEEIEGETLGERMRRLRAREDGDNPLPRARPVSAAFSAELLGQLGDTFKEEEAPASSSKDKQPTPANEEEETLGQRRRRLQAEREAREKEIGTGTGTGTGMGTATGLNKKLSMADVLGASTRVVLTDPRAEAEKARQAQAEKYRREQDQKLAVLRSQMPMNLSTPNLQRSGGYQSGQFNDGHAGGFVQARAPSMYGNMLSGGVPGHGIYGTGVVGGGMPAYGMPNYGYGMPLQQQLQVPMQQPGQQYDRVNQWRQSVIP